MRILAILVIGFLLGCQPSDTREVTQGDQQTASASAKKTVSHEDIGLHYPDTSKGDQIDNYHGSQVADPYRWLEDDVRESEDVANWVAAQNEVTFTYLNALAERERIKKRLTTLWDYEKYGVPFKQGGRYFFFLNNGLQNQSVLYSQQDLDSEPKVAIDPNNWSDDGTIALADVEISPDGRYAAMAIQDGGSDWRTIQFLDLQSGQRLEHEVQWMKFSSMVWAKNSSGVYYSRYPEPQEGAEFQSLNHNQAVYFHTIGKPQSEDLLTYSRKDNPDWGFGPELTDDGRFLVITIWKGTDNRYQIAYVDLTLDDAKPVTLIEGFDFDYTLVGNRGSVLYFLTNNDAPKGRLIAIDAANPDPANWKELVAENESVLRTADFVGEHFLARYLKDARSQVLVYAEDGQLVREVDLPGIGSVTGFTGEADDNETFYSYSSFNAPPTIYRYDVANGESRETKSAKVDFNPGDYIVKQVFYPSKDGTRIPMFIAHKSGLKLDGSAPTLLYGYGGFNIPMRPGFSITRLAWMEMGGVYAVANIRGGGEYGEEWHKAGTKLQKQNVFDDFIAAGEHLIALNYTQPAKLSVFGGSNGGLLVGAVVNQRPDLFAAALPAVGVMDMLRFHQFTAGRFWVDDYGSADDPEEFKALRAYSPYHNITDGVSYPAVLVTTADTDDRVVPGHSFKYAARLQEAHQGSAPVLIRIETRAGHGAGKPTDKVIEEYADRWAFLAKNLEMTLPEGYGDSIND